MDTDQDTYETDYDNWLIEMVQHCDCCPVCSAVPCDGVLAGGVCDEECHCDDDEYCSEDF